LAASFVARKTRRRDRRAREQELTLSVQRARTPDLPTSDDLEHHSALEHFDLEVSSVTSPIGRLTNAEFSFRFLPLQCVIGRQRAADGLLHQGEAIVRERLIIHRAAP
jgi:hypothetical protein